MKKITLNQLKSESFDPIRLVEESVYINPDDIEATHEELKTHINDLEVLKEALNFKKEKLLQKQRNLDLTKHDDLLQDLKNQLNRMKLEPLGDSREILTRNKEILELKLAQRILRYAIELEKDSEKVLDSLLNSEIREDWSFMCTLLFYCLKFGPDEQKEVFLKYSKRIEEKMVKIFSKALEENNITDCKSAIEALDKLEKKNVLLEEYLYNLDIFKNPFDIEIPEVYKIELDDFKLEKNTFKEFIRTIKGSYENNIQQYKEFFEKDDIELNLNKKIFKTLIYDNLDQFLTIDSPALFLLFLTEAYIDIDMLCNFIKSLIEGFEKDLYINDLIAPFVSRALEKEKQLFDEIFQLVVFNKQTSNKFVLNDKEIVYSEDYKKSYEIMLGIVDCSLKRVKIFYSADDKKELLNYYFRKLCTLIDRLIASYDDNFSLIEDLSFIYSISKDYSENNLEGFDLFVDKLDETYQQLLNKEVEQSNKEVFDEISKIDFSTKESHVEFIDCLKNVVKRGSSVKGGNFQVYIDKILKETSKNLNDKIFSLVFTKEMCKSLTKCMNDLLGSVILLNRTEMIEIYTHLQLIARMITLENEKFVDFYEQNASNLSDKEIKSILKSRSDGEDLRKLVRMK